MAPKVFLTENTGYIGDSLFSIAQAHPDWRFPVLVRNKEKAAKLASEYSQARVVDGDLDLADVIEEEVKNVDKVYHFADCDHEFSTKAIAKVVAYHTPPPPPTEPHVADTYRRNRYSDRRGLPLEAPGYQMYPEVLQLEQGE